MDKSLKTESFRGFLSGEIVIPPDKSISHRSLIIGAVASKQSGNKVNIKNLSLGEDCLSTLKILENTGVKIRRLSDREFELDAKSAFKNPDEVLDCGNSGTTARLLCGLFSSLNEFKCEFTGDESLKKRPMARVIKPLSMMGAKILSNDNKLPLKIEGKKLNAITYFSPIASAQVKSAVLLAGFNALGVTKVIEPYLSRNHTEIMLKYLGAKIKTGKDADGFWTTVESGSMGSKTLEIVGDISSAAFFMVAAAVVPNSKVFIKNVGINPTRTGILDVFEQAEVNFSILNERIISGEKAADIEVCYSPNIKPFRIKGDIIPRLIDEIPILTVLATAANGESIIQDAFDLRNKESDRIKAIVEGMKAFGVTIAEKKDGFVVSGSGEISSKAIVETHLDHRLAMSYYVMSLINKKETVIKGFDCVNTSFPEFIRLAEKLKQS